MYGFGHYDFYKDLYNSLVLKKISTSYKDVWKV